jgi:creatinine amidohydrolase
MRERPLAWLPLGILEQHGQHLPWGLDGLKAHAICLGLADRLGGVVLPASHHAGIHGGDDPARQGALRARAAEIGDFLYTEQFFRAFLHQTFDSLANIGFQVIVAYSGHYPAIQTEVLRDVAREFSMSGWARVIPFWEPLACGEGDHGGRWETSIYLALNPAGVRIDDIREDDTGRLGYYRGHDVRNQASVALGELALANIEAYLSREIGAAFNAPGGSI